MQKDYSKIWVPPQVKSDSYLTGLKVSNTLTQGNLNEFIPVNKKNVTWYMCGPTVYDHSHMGHARTYLGFDSIKKIMREYFGYNIQLCMNITDIDDKIIKRSNEVNEEFDKFARRFEQDFFEDMKNLNVEPPEVLTRVSEFVPDIITFIEKIIANNFAYESNGSVYFDVKNFQDDGKFEYGLLDPTNVCNMELHKEGEGVLTGECAENEKRNPSDFALWKKSKPGEPFWTSPWGNGRPGWHIECSAMANHVFDFPIDIHSGGVDLRFPHHTNEIAQSEACYNRNQWINYFIHSGHLHIEGLKMSKSLKNFISIKYLLTQHNANQIRLLFLLHKYDSLMCYNNDSIKEALQKEKVYYNYFITLKSTLRNNTLNEDQKWATKEFELQKTFSEQQLNIHQAFLENFNTPKVLLCIDDIIRATNVYLMKEQPKYPLLLNIQRYVKHIFYCMGLSFEEQQISSTEDVLAPVLDSFVKYRDEIRVCAKNQDLKGIFKACDNIRDEELIHHGIRLEDKQIGEPSIWKYENKERLLKERDEKIQAKLNAQLEKEKKEAEKLARMSVDPKTMFNQADLYSEWGSDGIPLKDKEGKEISKKKQTVLLKEQQKQEILFAEYLKLKNKD